MKTIVEESEGRDKPLLKEAYVLVPDKCVCDPQNALPLAYKYFPLFSKIPCIKMVWTFGFANGRAQGDRRRTIY